MKNIDNRLKSDEKKGVKYKEKLIDKVVKPKKKPVAKKSK